MGALAIAVTSAIFGAVLTHAAGVRLTRRAENLAARVAAAQLRSDFAYARQRLALRLKQGIWWPPAVSPPVPPFDARVDPLVARLKPEDMENVRGARDGLERMVISAELKHQIRANRDATPADFRLDDADREMLESVIERLDRADEILGRTTDELIGQPTSYALLYAGSVAVIGAILAISFLFAPREPVERAHVAEAVEKHVAATASSVTCSGTQAAGWTCQAAYEDIGLEEFHLKALQHEELNDKGKGGMEEALDRGDRMLVTRTGASGTRLEPGEPKPGQRAALVENGVVRTVVDDPTDQTVVQLETRPRKPWWKFWG